MANPAEGEVAIFLQLLVKFRSLRVAEATCLLSALRGHSRGLPSSLDEFVAACNRRLARSGMQICVGFDGESSSLVLRSSAAAELPLKAESLQKVLNKLYILSDAEVECTAAIFEEIMKNSAAISLPDFVRLCAVHRVPSAPKLVRSLLDIRWISSEAPEEQPDDRQLTLGPCFYLEVLPHLEGRKLPACAICQQPAILKLERCSSCDAEYHRSCLEELRAKTRRQEASRFSCCSCNAEWEAAA